MARISKSPLDFLRRTGLSVEPRNPAARIDLSALRVHDQPLKSPPLPGDLALRQLEGAPAPDRGATRPWPTGSS